MPRSLHPESGARLRLLCVEHDPDRARYALELYDPELLYASELAIEVEAESFELGAFEPEPPRWMRRWVELLLKSFVKAKKREREKEGAPRWPRRITRWSEQRER